VTIFASIMSSIFGGGAASASPAASAPSPTASQGATAFQAGRPSATMTEVDVAAVMDKLAAQSGQKLEWRKSIVDLMKLLDLDSSLTSRKELARELKFAGDMKDTATMNVWLHKQVMIRLAENGGKVPAELKQ
jgi:hypothetical protein